MLTVKGLTIRFPESTALALASAAFTLMGKAGVEENLRKRDRLHRKLREYLKPLGGIGVTGLQRDARRIAIETLRSDADARTEALNAIQRVYPKEEAPSSCWIVQAFVGAGPFIEPIDLNHPEHRFAQGTG